MLLFLLLLLLEYETFLKDKGKLSLDFLMHMGEDGLVIRKSDANDSSTFK